MKDTEKKDILRTENLERAYFARSQNGEKITYPVLKKLNLQVKQGEFVGIMGRSGCGKTTLLKALGLIDEPTGGKIFYKDADTEEIFGDDLAEIRRRQIAFVFQDYYLMDSLTVEENIMLPLIMDEIEAAVSRKRAKQVAEQFGIVSLMKKRTNELSGGEKQRVAICRALVSDPSLILADEPTGNLDSAMSQNVIGSLSDINKKMNKTIVMVTHDPIIASYCGRIVFLKDGEIMEDIVRNENSQDEFYQEIIERMRSLI